MRLVRAPGIDLNWQKSDGSTAAHRAEMHSFACVKVLATVPGVDWNRKDNNGWTPLHCALFSLHSDTVKTILAIPGVDYSVKTNDGNTLAHAAVQGGSMECLE